MAENNQTEKEKSIHEKLDNMTKTLEEILKGTLELHKKIDNHFKRIG